MKTKLLATVLLALLFVTNMTAQTVLFLSSVDSYDKMTNASDLDVWNTLEEGGYDLVYMKSQNFTVASIEEYGVECIYLSEAISRSDPSALYTAENNGEINVGFILAEPTSLRTTTTGNADALYWQPNCTSQKNRYYDALTTLTIPEDAVSHPIIANAGLSAGSCTVLETVDPDYAFSDGLYCNWISVNSFTHGESLLTSETATYNSIDYGAACRLFAIEEGTEVENGKVLAGRRVFFFTGAGNNQRLTTDGKALLLSSVAWAMGYDETDTDEGTDTDTETGTEDTSAKTVLFLSTVESQDLMTNKSDLNVWNTLLAEGYELVYEKSPNFTVASLEEYGVDCIYLSEAISRSDPASLYTAENSGDLNVGFILAESTAIFSTKAENDGLYWQYSPNGAADHNYDEVRTVTVPGSAIDHPIITGAGLTAGDYTVLEMVDDTSTDTNSTLCNWFDEALVSHGESILTSPDCRKGTTLTDATNGKTACRLFAIEEGTEVENSKVLQGRRVFIFIGAGTNQQLTADGEALLLSSVAWAIGDDDTSTGDDGGYDGINQESKLISYAYANNQLVINEEAASLMVVNLGGAVVANEAKVTSYDCSMLPVGIYIAKIETAQTTQIIRFVVK